MTAGNEVTNDFFDVDVEHPMLSFHDKIVSSVTEGNPVVAVLQQKNKTVHFVIIATMKNEVVHMIGDPSGKFDARVGNIPEEYTTLKPGNKTYERIASNFI